MWSSRSKKRVTVLIGVAAASTLICVLTFWQAFVIRYHLMRLQRSPEYFATLLEEPEESIALEALRRYVVTPQGSGTFVRNCLVHRLHEKLQQWLNRRDKPRLFRVYQGFKNLAVMYFTETNYWFEPGGTGQLDSQGRAARQTLLALLPLLDGKTITLTEYPDVTFTVRDQETALSTFHERQFKKSVNLSDYMFLLVELPERN